MKTVCSLKNSEKNETTLKTSEKPARPTRPRCTKKVNKAGSPAVVFDNGEVTDALAERLMALEKENKEVKK